MLRPILYLRLPENVRKKLQSSGYEYVEDVEHLLCNFDKAPDRLKTFIRDNEISQKIVNWNKVLESTSAVNLWHEEVCNPPVPVFHEGLYKLLDGGLPLGKITELCGSPGCGKTQMCLQFCVDVQIPKTLGGFGAEAFFISTDFGFDVGRLQEIAEGSLKHFAGILTEKSTLENFTVENLLRGVNVIRTHNVSGLLDAVRNLTNFLKTNQNVKLLVVDSFSLPLIVEIEDLILRSKISSELLDLLLDCAIKHKLAVVLTNQLSTIVANKKSFLKPSLGEGFGHRLHLRLLLGNNDNKIYLTKSINHPQLFTQFQITKDGIR